ncbi:hypothetical protein D3C85_1419960 [compost metagenome]
MNVTVYYTIFSIILAFALIATFIIGVSQKNRNGDQSYFQGTGLKWRRLTSYYVVSIIAGLLALVFYIQF